MGINYKNEKKQYVILCLLQYVHTISFYLLIPRNIYIKNSTLLIYDFAFFHNMISDVFIIVPIILGFIIAYIYLILMNLEKWYKPKIKKQARTPYGYINLATVLNMYLYRNGILILFDSYKNYKNINILTLFIITVIFIIFFMKNYRYNFKKQ